MMTKQKHKNQILGVSELALHSKKSWKMRFSSVDSQRGGSQEGVALERSSGGHGGESEGQVGGVQV